LANIVIFTNWGKQGVTDDYGNHLNHPFPFLGKLVDILFEPLLNVAPHGHYIDFMSDFYIEEFTFQVP
jgi:hypothetical protein